LLDDDTSEGTTDRRGFLAAAGVGVAGLIAAGLRHRTPDVAGTRTVPLASVSSPTFDALSPFQDDLRVPPVITPRSDGFLDIDMVSASIRWHSQMPPTRMWTYGGQFPGPTIEARRGEPTRISWNNKLTDTCPVKAVWVNPQGPGQGRLPYNVPGSGGGYLRAEVTALTAWTTVHLHGGHQNALYDGTTDCGVTAGNSQLAVYPNLVASHLFYHDHAMSITALNVMAGLAGNYIVRDPDGDRLGLPRGHFEVPLTITDVNFDTDVHGRLSGQLLVKRVMLNTSPPRTGSVPPSLACVGPFTAVNGIVWPRMEVEAGVYRFRIVNTSLARVYRLAIVDDESGALVRGAMTLIGTDMGLIGRPVVLDEALTLSPAERADIVVDFGPHAGRWLRMVNTVATAPPGNSVPLANIAHPEVMQFRVGSPPRRTRSIPTVLARDFKRVTAQDVPAGAVERMVITGYDEAGLMPQLWEMQDAASAPDGPVVQLATSQGVRNFRRVATAYEDTTTFYTEPDSWERWTFLSVAPPDATINHPMHIHLMKFQLLERYSIDSHGVDFRTGSTTTPITIGTPLAILPEESGWKDTVSVTANTMVVVAGKFAPQTGRVVYHCHALDHEDEGMMRPLVVLPKPVHRIHDSLMAMMGRGATR